MTIEVVIHREAGGHLRAAVLQQGMLGKNLLSGRSLTNVESAKAAAKQRLAAEFHNSLELEIVWTVKA